MAVEGEGLPGEIEVAADAQRGHGEDDHHGPGHPCALGELGHRGDDEDDARHHAADGVEGQALAPMRIARAPPVHDHPRLGEREGEEDPDCVERDQALGLSREGDEHEGRGHRENDDSTVEGQAVAHPQKCTWGLTVARKKEQDAREVVVGGVGGEEQHQRGGDLGEAIQRAVAEAAMGELGENCLAAGGDDPVQVRQDDDAGEHGDQQRDHPDERRARVAPFDGFEHWDGV